jgi:LPS sulfotransferase NodH
MIATIAELVAAMVDRNAEGSGITLYCTRKYPIARPPDDGFRYADYVRGALAAGRSGNGVFAARIMWETLGEVVAELRTMSPGLSGGSVSLLERAFGHVRFIYLRRDDIVAQAVSLLRAEQTSV